MCAASVYPEPGSNSHVNILTFKFFLTLCIFNSLLEFGWYYFLGLKNVPLGLFSLKDSLFTFQCTFLLRACGTIFILPYRFFFVNNFFKKIKFFLFISSIKFLGKIKTSNFVAFLLILPSSFY